MRLMKKNDEKRINKKSNIQQLGYYSGLGLQLVAAMCLFGWFGSWLDTKYSTTPWLMVVGLVLGATGGMISMLKAVIKANEKK